MIVIPGRLFPEQENERDRDRSAQTGQENERDREWSAQTGRENERDREQLVETGREKRTERERRKKITVHSCEEQQKQFKTSPVTLLLTHLVRPSLVESELSSFDLQQKPAKTKLGFIVNTMVDGSAYAG